MYTKSSKKNVWSLFLLILAGIVLGGFLGNTIGKLPYMEWLTYGSDFGIETPLIINLGILILHFGLTIKITIGGIIGILLAIIVYKKL